MPSVRYEVAQAVATVTLDSPTNRNALSAALVAEAGAAFESAAADPAVRAVVLTHTGSTFCAGNDLVEASTEDGPQRSTARLVALLRLIIGLPKPVVARIDGHVRAGGIGLVGACDIAIGGPGATFAFTEVRVGVVPAIVSLTTTRLMAPRASARYLLTGEVLDGRRASEVGLLSEYSDELDVAVDAVLDALRLAAPSALAETKALITADLRAGFDAQAAGRQQLSARMFASESGREGMLAFLEKRRPSWAVSPARPEG